MDQLFRFMVSNLLEDVPTHTKRHNILYETFGLAIDSQASI